MQLVLCRELAWAFLQGSAHLWSLISVLSHLCHFMDSCPASANLSLALPVSFHICPPLTSSVRRQKVGSFAWTSPFVLALVLQFALSAFLQKLSKISLLSISSLFSYSYPSQLRPQRVPVASVTHRTHASIPQHLLPLHLG